MVERLSDLTLANAFFDRLRQKAESQDLDRLHEAAERFEAIFANLLLKSLRESMTRSGLFGDGLRGEIYQGLLEEKLSEVLARRRQLGIADLIIRQLTRQHPTPSTEQQSSASSKTIDPQQRELLVKRAAQASNLPAPLIYAVIEQESGWNPLAVSSKGAKGLMQLMDGTAAMLGVKNVFNPLENVLAGSGYLRKLLDEFGRLELALAAYNAGPDTVRRYNLTIPPFPETQNYVRSVLNQIKALNLDIK
ncbi:MAG: transglycosylase SLT domain-containing protein [candidate division KSB1 bacterium]|nr:transglycosylase SLT domain-containing protein [candidate division KSB1 bacterium]MDQ7062664.1 transglycosylase SLT domain-containing protein [candidate division KSB1 bacterium]